MKDSLAIAYAMKRKAKKMSQGGELESGYAALPEPRERENDMADEDDDVVDRIMSRRGNMLSEGGKVANGSMTEDLAGFSPNEFDDLVLRDDLEQHDTGANSGDEIGDAQETSDRDDMIARIMRSRAKKDRLPNPR